MTESPARPGAQGLAHLAVAAMILLLVPPTAVAETTLASCTMGSELGSSVQPVSGLQILAPAIGYMDIDGDATLGTSDPVYVDLRADAIISVGDVRWSAAFGYPVGSRVAAADSDLNNVLVQFDVSYAYLDFNGDAQWNSGEILFLDAAPAGTVSIGDRYLSPAEKAGKAVGGADPEFGRVLDAAGGSVAYPDADADGVADADEALLYDRQNDGVAASGDVCLSTQASGPEPPPPAEDTCSLGSLVGRSSPFLNRALTLIPSPHLAFADVNGNAIADAGDVVYHRPAASDVVRPNDLRLSPYGAHPAGSRVRAADADLNLAVLRLEAPYRFVDVNGDAQWAAHEGLVLDLDANGRLDAGDLHLFPASKAGTFQPRRGQMDGTTLLPPRGGLGFVDDDGDAQLDATESQVWDRDASQTADAQDICMSGAVKEGGHQQAGGGATASSTPVPTFPANATTNQTIGGLDPGFGPLASPYIQIPMPLKEYAWALFAAALAGAAAVISPFLARRIGRFLALTPLFSRLQRHKLLDHKGRAQLHALVEANPGIPFQELVRVAGQPKSTAEYHVRRLIAGGLLRRHDSGGRAHLFVTGPLTGQDHPVLVAARSDATRRLLARVAATPGEPIARLALALGLPVSTVHDQVQRLVRDGLLEVRRHGREARVEATAQGRRALSAAPEVWKVT